MLFVVLLSCLLLGCATIKPTPYQEREHIYNVSFDTAWTKSIEMLTQENFPIKSMDKSNGIILTDYNKNQINDSWISKGQYTLSIFISSIDNGNIKVIINPSYEIYFPGGISATSYGPKIDNGEWVADNSKDKILIDKYFKILDGKLNK